MVSTPLNISNFFRISCGIKWGFTGFVVSDWGGMNDRVESLRAGTDLEMPGSGEYNSQENHRSRPEMALYRRQDWTSRSCNCLPSY